MVDQYLNTLCSGLELAQITIISFKQAIPTSYHLPIHPKMRFILFVALLAGYSHAAPLFLAGSGYVLRQDFSLRVILTKSIQFSFDSATGYRGGGRGRDPGGGRLGQLDA
jgi:hypothetical protein